MVRYLWLSALLLSACATSQPPAKAPGGNAGAAQSVTGIDPSAVDKKADPCDDFFAYACGEWINHNEIPPDKARWGRFDELLQANQAKLRDILEAAAAGKSSPEDRFGQKVGDFYAACMDEAGIEKTGLADLRAEWSRIDAIASPAELASSAARLHLAGVDALFAVGSVQDFKDSTKVIAGIFQAGLSLPDRDYYLKDDAKSAAIREHYLAHLTKMLELAGLDAAAAAGQAKAIFELEKSLAAAYWTRTELRDPHRIYNPLDVAGLAKAAPKFPWKGYLAGLGLDDPGVMMVSTPKALTRLSELLADTPLDTFRAYLRWRVMDGLAAARALPKAFVDERFSFEAENFTGAKELKPRWKHCTDLTDRLLGEALGQAFVRRWFGGDAKDKALGLIENIQKAMGGNIAKLAWMDAPTREKAIAKLGKIANKIGYPAKWRDYAALAVTRDSFPKSLLAAVSFETRRDLDKIGKPVDRTEWGMSPPTVNAYYNPQLNEMVFPAGILQPVFYTRGANDAVNYGAIGFVMGHELTHGFDDEGRKFDAAGNMSEWWTPAVSQEFDKRTACVEKQYSGYVAVDDVKLNGKLTLGENIADLGGLKLALTAYRAAHVGQPPESEVAGFSPEQQFFLSAAQVWCSKMRPEEARRRVVVDPHSPPRWRVNGPLSNMPDFAAAFQCKPGDHMVRAERCEVW